MNSLPRQAAIVIEMFNHEPKGYVCPLCLIAQGKPTDRGDQESDVVLRTSNVTAFISSKWWRQNKGHVIVIPNSHVENIYDMPEELGHAIFDTSKKIAIALKQAYGCDGTSVRQHNEPAGNQEVWHYHLHVFPRYNDDRLYQNHTERYWPFAEEKRPYAEKLKKYFQN